MTTVSITRFIDVREPGALPTWRPAMTPNTWREIPTANTLDDINPRFNPAINPNYPDLSPWDSSGVGQANIIAAWCGACFDDDTSTLWLPLSGGHGDYGGNEPYKIRLDDDAPQFVMLRAPSGAIGNEINLRDGLESTGVYADGRPRATHSYNTPVYVPGVGPIVTVQGNTSFSGQQGTNKAILLDEISGESEFIGDHPAPNTTSGGAGVYDPTRHCIWWRGASGSRFSFFDLASRTWTTGLGTSTNHSGYSGLEYIPEHDCLFWISDMWPNGFRVLDCQTLTVYAPSLTGERVGLEPLGGRMRPWWVPSLGGIAVWHNRVSDSTHIINLLKPDGDPRTDPWSVSQLPVDPSNVVVPTVARQQGTYGRFSYSSRLNGFVLLNATTQRPFFFAL